MGWIHSTDDETHDMWIQPLFVDEPGTSASTMRDGVTMIGIGRPGEDAWRPAGEVIAWQIVCDCERNTGELRSHRRRWASRDRWIRVPSPSLEDVAAGRVYADDDATADLDWREDLIEAAKAIWRHEHLRLVDVDEEISIALAAHRAAAVAIDVAIARARRAGRTWEQIGYAAGMSAPGANSRWKEAAATRQQLVDDLDTLITDLDGQVVSAAERVGLSITAVLAERSNGGHRASVADVQATYARMAPTPP
ncbi:hypothetical protein [Gordonia sihwensis]|uniref:Uncharacterized protein n=1 Tax=Gordonia sihwensis NBRC 108236 TaxID=1223544 RepID=L7LQJ8_9ACTN|nr:hypothetical protein [Gordonia sihwensis]GAC62368.1 hypothetical protein GSI01S_33_00540 [Gordonia sihwensis NBRC 108236]